MSGTTGVPYDTLLEFVIRCQPIYIEGTTFVDNSNQFNV